MKRYGPHLQTNRVNNWDAAIASCADGTWIKTMDDVAMSAVVKSVNPTFQNVIRFHRDTMQQFDLNIQVTRGRARDFIATWLNDSFFSFARYIDAIEDFNEYWAVSHTPDETEARILWVDSLIWVWENEILPDYPFLERIKWCLGNAAVGNDIPWQVADIACNSPSGPHYLGYHGYTSIYGPDGYAATAYTPEAAVIDLLGGEHRENFRDPSGLNLPYQINLPYHGSVALEAAAADFAIPGERSPDEYYWGSGRILHYDEREYQPRNLFPRYIFTECGLVRDASGSATLMPNDGWNDKRVADGDLNRYFTLISEVAELDREWNSRNGNRLEGRVLFTSGVSDWPGFHLDGGQLAYLFAKTANLPEDYTLPTPNPLPIGDAIFLTGVDAYSQQNPLWANDIIGQHTGHTKTIGNWGCLLTVYFMMARYASLIEPTEDVGVYNDRMTTFGAFTGPYLKPGALSMTHYRAVYNGFAPRSDETMLSRIVKNLHLGVPVPARVDFKPETSDFEQHWILITGYDGDGEFMVNDPWTGKEDLLSNLYAIPGTDVLEAIFYTIKEPTQPDYSKPRIDYARTYNVIPQDATLDRATEIFQEGWIRAKETAGGSADDAAYGELTDKVAVFHDIPALKREEYIQWIEEFYPRAQIEFPDSPEAAPKPLTRFQQLRQAILPRKGANK